MAQTIKVTLSIQLIRETIENETFQRSKIDKASTEGAALLAYLEAADADNDYQGRMFLRDLYSAAEEAKTIMTDYLNNRGNGAVCNLISETQGDNIVYQIEVSNRFNRSMAQPLARMLSKYCEDYILALWWSTSKDLNLMKVYQEQIASDIVGIKRCFNKLAPVIPPVYTASSISVKTTSIEITTGQTYFLGYTLDYGAVDDIKADVENRDIIDVVRSYDGFNIMGCEAGETSFTISSSADASVKKTIYVTVTDPS